MNLGPVKHEESFGANIFLLRVHSLPLWSEIHEGKIAIIYPIHHCLLQYLEQLLVSAVNNDLLHE